ncbi:hypothetical protein GOP47_0004925 [Adiantum capillus-veneris]|uniref:Uncharacterized protein n=1 Tax=Adiantum capillus-veneris TaxID=13818 RepID=A0A9D4V4Z7_ADICA|nr:hypothetical protein GOP47_0004925 [Adiantum capillus-veneris]
MRGWGFPVEDALGVKSGRAIFQGLRNEKATNAGSIVATLKELLAEGEKLIHPDLLIELMLLHLHHEGDGCELMFYEVVDWRPRLDRKGAALGDYRGAVEGARPREANLLEGGALHLLQERPPLDVKAVHYQLEENTSPSYPLLYHQLAQGLHILQPCLEIAWWNFLAMCFALLSAGLSGGVVLAVSRLFVGHVLCAKLKSFPFLGSQGTLKWKEEEALPCLSHPFPYTSLLLYSKPYTANSWSSYV